MRLNGSRTSIETLVREAEGFPPDLEKAAADRLEQARRAKAIRPFYNVVPLDQKQATVAARESIEIPSTRLGFPFIAESIITDQQQSSVLFNFAREEPRGRRYWFTSALRASFLAGDSGADDNRVAPQDAFYMPEAQRFEANERLSVIVSGDPATVSSTLTNTYLTVKGLRVFPSTSPEGHLDDTETRGIKTQIAALPRREWRLSRCHIDFSTSALSTDVDIENINEWTLLWGIATTLRWSLFKIKDAFGYDWTNSVNGIPSAALGAYPFYADGTSFENYKLWTFPYLIPPRNSLSFSATKRAASGGFTNNVTEDNAGEIVLIHTTV
jgi:hypothetical protein